MESKPKAASGEEGIQTSIDSPSGTEFSLTDELTRAIAMLQEAAKEAKKVEPAYNLTTIRKALSSVQTSRSIIESLGKIEDSLKSKVESAEKEFDIEIRTVASELGVTLEGGYPHYVVRQPDGRTWNFEVLEPNISYSVEGRTVKKTDLKQALLAVPRESNQPRARHTGLDEATFKRVLDLAYNLATTISQDDTVMIRRVVDVASSVCKSLGVEVNCNQLVSKFYFEGGLNEYELFQSGGKDSAFTFQQGDSQARRTLMKRKSHGTGAEGT